MEGYGQFKPFPRNMIAIDEIYLMLLIFLKQFNLLCSLSSLLAYYYYYYYYYYCYLLLLYYYYYYYRLLSHTRSFPFCCHQ